MRYEYQGPGSSSAIPVGVAVSELNRLIERDGSVTAGVLVDESRPDHAPLHAHFEWRNDVAAELHRQQQARQLIRAVVLVAEPERHEVLPTVRAYVSIHNPDGDKPQSRYYKPTLSVLQTPGEAEELKRRFRSEVLNLRQRYMALLELDESLRNSLTAIVQAAS